MKNICVIGGSGFVGMHLVAELTRRGYEVRVLTRDRERAKTDLIILPTAQAVAANVHDEAELGRQFAGMDAVVNLAGILNESRSPSAPDAAAARHDFQGVHAELPRKIVNACVQGGVRRLLHMSALHADVNGPSAYLRSKGAGEETVRAAGAAPSAREAHFENARLVPGHLIHTTIFRPSVIFGRGDRFLNLFARLAKIFPVIPLGCPNSKFQPIYVEDVARAFADSLENEASFGKSYDLCGPRVYTLRELVEYVVRTLGLKRVILGLPDRLSYLQAWSMEFLPMKLMTRDNYYSMQVDSVCQCEFPFPFPPSALEAVVPEYLAGISPRRRYNYFRYRARR